MRLPNREIVRAPQCQGVDRSDLQALQGVQETDTNSSSGLISPALIKGFGQAPRLRYDLIEHVGGNIRFSGNGRFSRKEVWWRWRGGQLSTAVAKVAPSGARIARRRAFFLIWPPSSPSAESHRSLQKKARDHRKERGRQLAGLGPGFFVPSPIYRDI